MWSTSGYDGVFLTTNAAQKVSVCGTVRLAQPATTHVFPRSIFFGTTLVDAVRLQLLRGRQSFAWLELAAAHTSIASTAP